MEACFQAHGKLMSFPVRDKAGLSGLTPGERVDFDLAKGADGQYAITRIVPAKWRCVKPTHKGQWRRQFPAAAVSMHKLSALLPRPGSLLPGGIAVRCIKRHNELVSRLSSCISARPS